MPATTSVKPALADIRTRHELAPTCWEAVYYGEECHLRAYPPGCPDDVKAQETAIREHYATMDGIEQEAIALLSNAHDDIAFLLEALDHGIARVRELEGKGGTPADDHSRDHGGTKHGTSKRGNADRGEDRGTGAKDYAAECAMKCAEPAFRKFLKQCHGLDHATDDKTAAKVRELLGIASRRLLNTDHDKAQLWRKLVNDYEGWLQHGR